MFIPLLNQAQLFISNSWPPFTFPPIQVCRSVLCVWCRRVHIFSSLLQTSILPGTISTLTVVVALQLAIMLKFLIYKKVQETCLKILQTCPLPAGCFDVYGGVVLSNSVQTLCGSSQLSREGHYPNSRVLTLYLPAARSV